MAERAGRRYSSAGVIDEPPDLLGSEVPAPKRRRRAGRIILICAVVLAVLVGGGLIAGGLYLHSVESGVQRVNAFQAIPEANRPKAVAAGAENMLLLGSDTRDPENTGGSRSDTMMLLHLPKGKASAQIISIPRDTWVHVPTSPNGKYGNTDAKINAAYAWGGPALMIETVEGFTGVRIDHFVMVDFAGFAQIIDALGGVDIYVAKSFDSHYSLLPSHFRHFDQGMQHMDGAMALDYSRERHAFDNGDFARIQHQQQMLKAVLDKAVSGGTLTDPGKLNNFLKSATKVISVDESMSLLNTAMSLRNLRSANLSFFTNPSKGTGRVGTQSVVFPDTAKDKTLYDAVQRDDVSAILAAAK